MVGTSTGGSGVGSRLRTSLTCASRKAAGSVVSVGSMSGLGSVEPAKTFCVPARPVVEKVPVRSICGLVWFLKNWMSMSLISCWSCSRRISGRLARASLSEASRLMGVSSKLGWSVGSSARDHSGVERVFEHQVLEVVLGDRDALRGDEQRLLARR